MLLQIKLMSLLEFRNMITVSAAVESSGLFRVVRMMQWDSEVKKLSQGDVSPSDSRNVFKKVLLLHVALIVVFWFVTV